jgi:23S rRNA (cytosine1962-C5)-methyltransferase
LADTSDSNQKELPPVNPIRLRQGGNCVIYLSCLISPLFESQARYVDNSVIIRAEHKAGFALACARAGAAKVTAVDISESACAAARRNAELNGLDIEVIAHNVFDFLKHATPEYDLIILDPPSFTRNKKTLMDAMRGYKEIHLRSLKLLDKGGILSTFCCSHHASRELFQANLVDAAVDAKKSLRLVANHGQRADHPVLLAIPETEYLKGITAELMAGR